MKVYFDLDLQKLVQGSASGFSTTPLSEMELKRRDGAQLEIVFLRGTTVITTLDAGTEIHFIAKQSYDGDTLIHNSTFVWDADEEAWVGSVSTNTTELNGLFTDDNEPESEALLAEISFREDPADPWTSSQTIDLTVWNDIYTGSEGSPVDAADPNDYRTAAAQDALTPRNDQDAGFDTTEENQLRKNLGLFLVEQTLTDGANIAWDMEAGWSAKVTLAGNRTLDAPTNAPFIGAEGFFTVIQDATGSRTLTLNAAWVPLGGVLILNPAAAAVSRFKWRYDGTNYLLWRVSGPHAVALTDAATIAWDMQFGLNATVTLAGNRTLGNPTNKPDAGASGFFVVKQDGTGSRTLAFDTDWDAVNGAISLNATAGDETQLAWFYDGTKLRIWKP